MTDYVMISKEEYELLKVQKSLTPQDVSEILEYSDVITKFLDVGISGLRAELANFKLVGREGDAYLSIKTIENLKESLTKLEPTYKNYLIEIEKGKEKKK